MHRRGVGQTKHRSNVMGVSQVLNIDETSHGGSLWEGTHIHVDPVPWLSTLHCTYNYTIYIITQ
jgi:hypothetical protein